MNLAPENVSFLGIGRRTVSKMLSFDLDKIKAFQPKVIILDLGTNDLCVAASIGTQVPRPRVLLSLRIWFPASQVLFLQLCSKA